jgi:hypothetical protein
VGQWRQHWVLLLLVMLLLLLLLLLLLSTWKGLRLQTVQRQLKGAGQGPGRASSAG